MYDKKRHILRDRQPSTAACALPSLLSDGDKGIEIVYGELEQPGCRQKSKPNKPTKEGPLSFVLFESPFTSVSTVSSGHPSLISLMARSPLINYCHCRAIPNLIERCVVRTTGIYRDK